MENIFFLVLVGVVGLLRWLMQNAEKRKNSQAEKAANAAPVASAPPPLPQAQGQAQTEEERMRKFFEALGLPSASSPPPKVQSRPIVPPRARAARKILPVDPFPTPRFGGGAQQPVLTSPPPVAVAASAPAISLPQSRSHSVAAVPAAPEEFEVRDLDRDSAESNAPRKKDPKVAMSQSATSSLATRLATPEGLRDAIVLREIFGPPRSMQRLEPQPFG
jgi:hypothetical protein